MVDVKHTPVASCRVVSADRQFVAQGDSPVFPNGIDQDPPLSLFEGVKELAAGPQDQISQHGFRDVGHVDALDLLELVA